MQTQKSRSVEAAILLIWIGCRGPQTTRISDRAGRIVGSNREHAAIKNLQSLRISNPHFTDDNEWRP